ncbi:tripartite tricarboxylate transporter TctB family protein [Desulfovibrio sp. OttesenSCG-928-O18]|nr:tripartite tricarboxylate transporter TctB family protein [Desulfovibrio sp. OttesenSCG-928-O18]
MKIPEYKTHIYGGIILGMVALLLYFVIIPREIVFTQQKMGVSPQYFPNLLAGMLFVLAIALGINGYRNRNRPVRREYTVVWKETRLVIFTLAVIGVQIIGFDTIGYLIPAMLAIAVCMYIYGHKNYITIVIVSVALPVGIMLFFEKTLQVYLP